MKKIDNYTNAFRVLQKADFGKTSEDEIYRMGVIGQYNFTFEMAWKAIQEMLQIEGISEAGTGSPRDILKLAYTHGYLEDQEQWLLMLKKRNANTHIYDEEEIDELLVLIKDSFIPAFGKIEAFLKKEQCR